MPSPGSSQADNTPLPESPPTGDHANVPVQFTTPENSAWPGIWEQFVDSPWERVKTNTSFRVASTSPVLHAHDATTSAGPLFFSSPQLSPSSSSSVHISSVSPLSLDNLNTAAATTTPALSPVIQFGPLFFSSPQLSPSSSSSVHISSVSPLSLDNLNAAAATTTPALSPAIQFLPGPQPLAGQVLPPLYSPPPYIVSLPGSGIDAVPVLPQVSMDVPPFNSHNSVVVELPLYPPVFQPAPQLEAFQALQASPPLPPPPYYPPSDQLNGYIDGGTVSNALSFPLMVTPNHIQHINQQWSYIFIHAWHTVFHDTYTTSPPSNLVQTANRALTNAYLRWEQLWPNDPILPAPITIDGVSMTAIRNYNAPSPIKPILTLFNRKFKHQIRSARNGAMTHLMRCTLGALVVCQVAPFLPTPHIDTRPSHPNPATFLPRVYTELQKDAFQLSIMWDDRWGCRIWHEFEVDRIIWFGNVAARRFLFMLLSHEEDAPYALGVRRARGGPSNVVTSWGPLAELDNHSVLSLLAKSLASLSTSIIVDVAQRPRQYPFDQSDGHRNRAINELSAGTLRLLRALDDLAVPYPALPMQQREDGHSQLIRLKEDLGFGA